MSGTRLLGQRLTTTGYAQALRLLVDGEATWCSLAADLGVTRATAQRVCAAFHRHGLTHVVRWQAVGKDARSLRPVYAFGAGADALRAAPDKRRSATQRTPSELLTFCAAVQLLSEDSYHGAGLAAATGIGAPSSRRLLRALREHKLIYVESHQERRNAGTGYPLWTWGPDHKDRAKPKPKSKTELWTNHNAKRASHRQHAVLMHGIVNGVSLDGRRHGWAKAWTVTKPTRCWRCWTPLSTAWV